MFNYSVNFTLSIVYTSGKIITITQSILIKLVKKKLEIITKKNRIAAKLLTPEDYG